MVMASAEPHAQGMFTCLMKEMSPGEVTRVLDTTGVHLLGALGDLQTTLKSAVVDCGVQDLTVPLGGNVGGRALCFLAH